MPKLDSGTMRDSVAETKDARVAARLGYGWLGHFEELKGWNSWTGEYSREVDGMVEAGEWKGGGGGWGGGVGVW